MTKVLVTGAGGPAGVAVIRSLLARPDADVFAADMDGWASGLYLVPPDRRRIVPPGADAAFVDDLISLCKQDEIDVLVSTVDVELPRSPRVEPNCTKWPVRRWRRRRRRRSTSHWTSTHSLAAATP